MTSTTMRPHARTSDVISTRSDDDLLVFDQRTNHLHHLDRGASAVWNMCDGTLSLTDLAEATGLTTTEVDVILNGLSTVNLLETPWNSGTSTSRLNRRRFLRKAGLAAGIISVSVPLAARAQPETCLPDDCTSSGWGQHGTRLAGGSRSVGAASVAQAQAMTCVDPEDCVPSRWGNFCCPGGSQVICAKDLSDDSFTCIPSDMCADPDWYQVECFPLTG